MKILNISSCNIYFVYALDHIVTPGETQKSTSLQVFPKARLQTLGLGVGGEGCCDYAGVSRQESSRA